MNKMTLLCSAVVVTVLLPVAGFAQTNDAAYCKALVEKYEQYLAMDGGRVRQPLNMEARYGAEKCKAGDPSGIPAIEKALINAKLDLPPRG